MLVRVYQRTRDKWVPVTTAWRVLRLRMEELPPIWRVAANILNKQSRTADKGWSSSLGVGRDAETPRRKKVPCCEKKKNTCDCGNEPSGCIK